MVKRDLLFCIVAIQRKWNNYLCNIYFSDKLKCLNEVIFNFVKEGKEKGLVVL